MVKCTQKSLKLKMKLKKKTMSSNLKIFIFRWNFEVTEPEENIPEENEIINNVKSFEFNGGTNSKFKNLKSVFDGDDA